MNPKKRARILLLALPLLILSACTSTPKVAVKPAPVKTINKLQTVDDLLMAANQATEPRRSFLYIQAAQLISATNPVRAAELLNLVSQYTLNEQQLHNYTLLSAELALTNHHPRESHEWLDTLFRPTLNTANQQRFDILQARLADLEEDFDVAIQHWGNAINHPKLPENPQLFHELWNSLLREDSDNLKTIIQNYAGHPLQPWLELAIIYRSPSELNQQLAEISQWQNTWAGSAALEFMPEAVKSLRNTPPYQPSKIAILLPLTGQQAAAGKAVQSGFMAGYYKASNNGFQVPEITFYDTWNNDPAQLASQAQSEGAELIIGPLRRSTAQQSLNNTTITVPWLILNHIPEQSMTEHPSVYQFSLASEPEAAQAAQRAWKDGYRKPVILTPDTPWGLRVAESFKHSWEQQGGAILSQHTYSKNDYNGAVSDVLLVKSSFKRANALTRLLGERLDYTPRRRQDLDMVFIVGSPTQGRQLKPALDYYFAYNLPVYTVSNMYQGKPDPVQDRDLNDVRIPLMPWFASSSAPLKSSIAASWKESRGPLGPLFALGADSWRIYPRLEQMSRSEGAQLFGATGILSISPKQEVIRQLNWQYFRNGRPAPLSHERSMRPELNTDVLENGS